MRLSEGLWRIFCTLAAFSHHISEIKKKLIASANLGVFSFYDHACLYFATQIQKENLCCLVKFLGCS